jgi:protein-S-isoprenylcysteine O-methyltransferase Ste14
MTSPSNSNAKPGIPWRGLISLLILIALMPCVLFLCAGRLDWWEGWAYTANVLIVMISSRALILIKSPDMARERSEAGGKEDVKSWDRTLMPLTAIVGPFAAWIVVGLDERFGWTPDLPDPIQIAALLVIFLGNNIGTWAMLANRFFSSQVRIQSDRNQTIVSTGPYRFVRHPGYAGGILAWLAGPVFFSSYWSVIPTVIVIALMVVRTALEDRTLMEELPGYREYAQKVRYRLLPGIW